MAKGSKSITIFALALFSLLPVIGQAKSADESKIEALNAALAAAINAKDVNAIMKVYVPDESLVVFDILPPRQYVGANAFRTDWENFLSAFKGPVKFEISDLHIEADGTLGCTLLVVPGRELLSIYSNTRATRDAPRFLRQHNRFLRGYR